MSTTSANSSALSVLDSTFLRIETDDTPMHVGVLMVFDLPDDAGPQFVADVTAHLRSPLPLRRPFNRVLNHGLGSSAIPSAHTVETLDMEYHVRHTALPSPGGERQLGELISHLSSTRLDRRRPLWTCHVIEGLEGGRFAVYTKIHHSMTDGVNGVRMATDNLARTPDGEWRGPWHAPVDEPQKRTRKAPSGEGPDLAARLTGPARVLGSLATGVGALIGSRRSGESVRLPFEAPNSTLNKPVTGARRVATQQLDMERMQAVASRAGASLNDVFLSVCGDALRRYLLDTDELPEQSLIAGVPVNLREEGKEGGNAVGFVWAVLGTDVADPVERLAAVQRSMTASKQHLQSMNASARPVFTLATMSAPVLTMIAGQAARLPRPPMNVTVSNVPGPKDVRYVAGGKMTGCYPISLVFQGMGLNITCISYDGQFNIGIVGSRDSLPSMQKISVYLVDALDDLDAAVPA